MFSPEAPIHARIEALKQFNRDIRPLPDQACRSNPLGMLWPEMDAWFVSSSGGNGGPQASLRRPVIIIAAG